jgi:hypothetical protein
MSFNVLVIPEDFTKDEHILKPLVERICSKANINATVTVCRDPNFRGRTSATNEQRLRDEVVARYPMVDLFILMVDRDGDLSRDIAMENLQSRFDAELTERRKHFFASLAWQEVEVFVLAGHTLNDGWRWTEIRSDPDVKNTYFMELVIREGTGQLPHQGRKKLMAIALREFRRILSLCPEDLGRLYNLILRIRP